MVKRKINEQNSKELPLFAKILAISWIIITFFTLVGLIFTTALINVVGEVPVPIENSIIIFLILFLPFCLLLIGFIALLNKKRWARILSIIASIVFLTVLSPGLLMSIVGIPLVIWAIIGLFYFIFSKKLKEALS